MPGPIKNRHIDYSKFDNMSTAELEDILRLDSQLPDDEVSDMNTILYIMEVIAKREKEHPTGKFTDVSTAWASFKENYLPCTDDKSIYDYEGTDTHVGIIETPLKKFYLPKIKLRMMRVATIIATISALLLAGTLTVNALGFDLWGAVARWTKDTFGFCTISPKETMSSLQDTLDKYGITAELAPTWLPDGYLPENVEVTETPLKTTIEAKYTRTDDEISITIIMLSKQLTRTYEKDGKDVTVYTADGVEHFIMTNLGHTNIVWRDENYECSIIGDFSIDEAKKMINSIYERK